MLVTDTTQELVTGSPCDDHDGTPLPTRMSPRTPPAVDRWVDEQLFEEDIRAVLMMMRPNRRERLAGWSEYRTGGRHFRATISWDPQQIDGGTQALMTNDSPPHAELFTVPNLVDVLESILIGSIQSDNELSPQEECEAYRAVLRALDKRIGEFQACYA